MSVGAFSGVENAEMRGSSQEMPKTGSPLLAKGELQILWLGVELAQFFVLLSRLPVGL
jgi:hypothetical protein